MTVDAVCNGFAKESLKIYVERRRNSESKSARELPSPMEIVLKHRPSWSRHFQSHPVSCFSSPMRGCSIWELLFLETW